MIDQSIGGVDQSTDLARLDELGRLAGGVAHDFNNLLGVISNYAAFVADAIEVARTTNDVSALDCALDDVRQIAAAAERATTRTRQLLAFARQRHAHECVVDVNAIVTDTLAQWDPRREVLVQTSLASSLPAVVADPGQIEEMLNCLIANAYEAMPHGGELRVATHASAASFAGVEVQVTDTGLGMTDKVKSKAFEPFFTTKGLGGGVGLGLPTVYGIVTRAGGSVSIASTRGTGTTVTVWLPDCDGAAATG